MVERRRWSGVHLTGGGPTVCYHMTQIRQRRMISVIAWVIAGSIDGWQRLMKTLRQITFFPHFFFRHEERWRKAPREVGAILTAPSVMCVTSKPQLLWAGFLRPIPVRVKREALTSGELPARREIIQLPALKKLKGGQNPLCCSLQNFKENQVPTWNNRIFGFLFMSWTSPPPPVQGSLIPPLLLMCHTGST